MRVVIDLKSTDIYEGGISAWFAPLLAELSKIEEWDLIGISPKPSSTSLSREARINRVELKFPKFLPSPIANLIYDQVLFPHKIKQLAPQLVISPYFDVRVPKSVSSFITIHDVCHFEVPKLYGLVRGAYFRFVTRASANQASKILTVSNTSIQSINRFLGVNSGKVALLENILSNEFKGFKPSDSDLDDFKIKYQIGRQDIVILYTGGIERRKNILNLLQAFVELNSDSSNYKLMITGNNYQKMTSFFEKYSIEKKDIIFTERLSEQELRIAYRVAAVLVNPSLSEGFGRSNLEALFTKTPIACSNLQVFQELCGDNATYFTPDDSSDIANKIVKAIGNYPVFDYHEYENKMKNNLATIVRELRKYE